jgi:hypothetical protein
MRRLADGAKCVAANNIVLLLSRPDGQACVLRMYAKTTILLQRLGVNVVRRTRRGCRCAELKSGLISRTMYLRLR